MEDKNIICKDCGKEFANDPVRCPDCRKIRKNQKRNN